MKPIINFMRRKLCPEEMEPVRQEAVQAPEEERVADQPAAAVRAWGPGVDVCVRHAVKR